MRLWAIRGVGQPDRVQEEPSLQAGQSVAGRRYQPRDQSFNTTIMGGTNIAVGSKGVTQTVQVQAGDLEGLKAYLASLGVGQTDFDELAIALTEDEPPKEG